MRKHYDFSKATRGPVIPLPPGKTTVLITINEEILEWLSDQVDHLGGGEYSDIINRALEIYIRSTRGELAELVRRVIREELQAGARLQSGLLDATPSRSTTASRKHRGRPIERLRAKHHRRVA